MGRRGVLVTLHDRLVGRYRHRRTVATLFVLTFSLPGFGHRRALRRWGKYFPPVASLLTGKPGGHPPVCSVASGPQRPWLLGSSLIHPPAVQVHFIGLFTTVHLPELPFVTFMCDKSSGWHYQRPHKFKGF